MSDKVHLRSRVGHVRQDLPFRAIFRCLIAAALLTASAAGAFAQSGSSATDGMTPLALQPGAPAGSYELSGFDTVNLFNGTLGFHLPILDIKGRGAAQMRLMLTISQRWRVVTRNLPGGIMLQAPQPSWWLPFNNVGYGPGFLVGRQEGGAPAVCSPSTPNVGLPYFGTTLTRLTFTAPDGTEYEFRDASTDGQPGPSTQSVCQTTSPQPFSRGTIWKSVDGTAATFISQTPITDTLELSGTLVYPTGVMTLADGTKYVINAAEVQSITDRNGNMITFQYDPSGLGNVSSITDSLGRTVTIKYHTTLPGSDTITYNGFNGASRVITINWDSLHNALRKDFGTQVMSFKALFPELQGDNGELFDPPVVTSMVLPDPNLAPYSFFYNLYGELARVQLPTGGATEYDYISTDGILNTNLAGTQVVRPVTERRVYPDGTNLEQRTTYSVSESFDNSQTAPPAPLNATTTVTVTHKDSSNTVLTKETHLFIGDVESTFLPLISQQITDYSSWQVGKEKETDQIDPSTGNTLRQTVNTFTQSPDPAWWTGDPNLAPEENPHLTTVQTTLSDTGQVSKITYAYDQYSNRVDEKVYDFGSGSVGALLRETQTSYVTTVNPGTGSVDYVSDTSPVHIRNLPQTITINGGGSAVAQTVYTYDSYPNNLLFDEQANASGHDANFTASFLTRGNATLVAKGIGADTVSTSTQYDIYGNVVSVIDPIGTASTDPNVQAAHTTTIGYSGNLQCAFPTTVTGPPPDPNGVTGSSKGLVITNDYDLSSGLAKSRTDANGNETTAQYSDPGNLDRVSEIDDPDGGATTYAYTDTVGSLSLTSTTKEDQTQSIVTSKFFDGLGRVTSAVLSEGGSSTITTRTNYDGLGRAFQVSNPYRPSDSLLYTTTSYDALSRAISVTGPDGSVVTTSYNGNQTLVSDQAQKERLSQVDALGRLSSIWEITAQDSATVAVTFPNHSEVAAGYLTVYGYDPMGNLISVTQGAQSRTYTYDTLSRLLNAKNPEQVDSFGNQVATVYAYDKNSNLKSKANPNGTSVTFAYDGLNRVTTKTLSAGGTFNYHYDSAPNGNGLGRLDSVKLQASLGLQIANDGYYYDGYDTMGRVTTARQITAGVSYPTSYVYDFAGHMTQETYPSGHTIKTSFDSAGRASDVQRVGGTDYATALTYAANGAMVSMTLGNGLVEHTTYNSRFQPTLIGLGASSNDSSVFKLDYGFGTTNNNGNVLTETITVGAGGANSVVLNQSYNYDQLNRLSTGSETNNGLTNWSRTFNYDRFGNMWVTNPVGITPGNLTPKAPGDINSSTNRLTGSGYDPSGNQTSDLSANIYGYDSENHMTSCTVTGTASSYGYDAEGYRVWKTVGSTSTIFVYNVSGQLIAEYGGPPPVTGGTSYLTTDHLGSTRVTTDSAGAVRSRDDYLPFGEEIGTVGRSGIAGYSSSTDIHQKFTSKERDVESMLDYFLARYYASSQGRFASVDPLNDGPKQPDPQTLNGYEYCRNNPIKYVDADGQKIRITDANGNYEDISDDQASQTIFNKKWIRSLGYWVQDQKVFDEHGNVIGSYRRISYDDWSDFQNRAIFGVVARADAMNQAIAAFGVGTIAAGATGGVGLYGLTSTGVVGSLTTLGVASGPGALTAVGSTDAAVLSLAIDDGASATGSFEENVGALSRALRQLRPGNQVNKIGELDGKPIFGSLITRGGIASRNGITFVVKVLPEGVKILGPLAK